MLQQDQFSHIAISFNPAMHEKAILPSVFDFVYDQKWAHLLVY